MNYDLIIIGGGPAGYLAGERAGHAGLNVLLIEKRNVGGVCLNEGCIPTKTLLYSAKLKDGVENGKKYGVRAEGLTIDHKKVVQRKNKVVKKLTAGVSMALKSHGVTVVDGEGRILGQDAQGYQVGVNDQVYTGKRLLIATGSQPAVPPIPGLAEGLDAGFVKTNREILDMKEVPEKLIVIGGGVIGLEMSSYFNSVGSDVTVIEMLERIGGMIDEDIAEILLADYQKKGIAFHLSSKVTAIGDGSVTYESAGETVTMEADCVLLSIGRRPSTQGIGLETIGVETDRGAILADERMRTNVTEVYTAGDVNGRSMLAHTAYREAEVAVNNMLGIRDTMSYETIPAVIYTNPEVAGVGILEQQAREKGMDITVKTITMNYSGRYMAENEGGNGIIKIIVDNRLNTLAGVHIVGNYASEIIYGAGIMIEKKMTIDEIKRQVFPHPTVAEIIREAIFQL